MQNSSSANIRHVVVLMFENRSFDHILGAIPGVNGILDASGNLKPDQYNYLDPTNPDKPGNIRQAPFPIAPGDAEKAYIANSHYKGFDHDLDAMFSDLYGPGATGVVKGRPVNNSWPVYPATSSGFVANNPNQYGGEGYPEQYSVMSYFQRDSMKVFHKLAQEYTICENWFCDMPGHTAPNRAFMHCATTGDMHIENGDNAHEVPIDPQHPPSQPPAYMVNRESIFERLEKFGNTWKMYAPGQPPYGHMDTYFLNDEMAGFRNYNPDDPGKSNCAGVPLSQFCKDVQSDDLPTYSFIMCFGSAGDTTMHPMDSVEPGENLLAGVYNTLRNSKHWNDTLLVVNFDENGGMYDHVPPPRTVPPHPEDPAQTVKVPHLNNQGIVTYTTYTFDFSILGFRIPTLLISPWLKKGIEMQQLQNTSVLRFLQDQFCQPAPPFDPLQPPTSYLTQRDRFANSIQIVFDNAGLATPRTDCSENIDYYDHCPYGICSDTAEPIAEEILQAAPKASLVDLTLEYIAALPGHPESGRHINRQFATVADLKKYAFERTQAAALYYGRV